MKHINDDVVQLVMIFDRRPVSHPLNGLKGWDQKFKIQLFQNTVMCISN